MIRCPGKLAALVAASLVAATTGLATAPVAYAVIGAAPLARWSPNVSFGKPPTTADCEAQFGIACYSPQQYQTAYDLAPLYEQGLRGAAGRSSSLTPSDRPPSSTTFGCSITPSGCRIPR